MTAGRLQHLFYAPIWEIKLPLHSYFLCDTTDETCTGFLNFLISSLYSFSAPRILPEGTTAASVVPSPPNHWQSVLIIISFQCSLVETENILPFN